MHVGFLFDLFQPVEPVSPTPSNESGRVRGFHIPALKIFTILLRQEPLQNLRPAPCSLHCRAADNQRMDISINPIF